MTATTILNTTRQVFVIPTFNSAFQWTLDDSQIRNSFFEVFLPDLTVSNSVRIDNRMNPLQELELARKFLHDPGTKKTVRALRKESDWAVLKNSGRKCLKSTALLKTFVERFEDFKSAFPEPLFDGTMDFICTLEQGDHVLVEMQVIPQEYWDRRALAYVAALYSRQLIRGDSWKDIKKVIGINILGGGWSNTPHWKEDQYLRHYKLQEQLQKNPPRYIDGIEILQYALAHVHPEDCGEQSERDWIEFLTRAPFMSEEEVAKKIKTEAVLKAFDRIKVDNLPKQVKKAYDKEEAQFAKYAGYTAQQKEESFAKGKAEGLEKGKAEGLQEGLEKGQALLISKMLESGLDFSMIEKLTGLSPDEIAKLVEKQ